MLVEREKKFSDDRDENCQQNELDLEGSLVTSSRPPVRPQKSPDDRTWNGGVAVQLMAAGEPQVLTTGSICGKDAAIFHVVWCLVLQTAMNRCTQLIVLHPLGNAEPVQFVVEQIGESAIVLPRVGDDASSGIHNSLELVCGGLGCPHENGIVIVDA